MNFALGFILLALVVSNNSLAQQIINAKIGKHLQEPVLTRGLVIEKEKNFIKILVLNSSYKNNIIKLKIPEGYEKDINSINKDDTVIFYFDGESVEKIKKLGD